MRTRNVSYAAVQPEQAAAVQCSTRTERVNIECPVDKKTAALILGVSAATLDQWTDKYSIPHIKYDMDGNRGNRGKVLYLPSELLAFRDRFKVEARDIGAEVAEMLEGRGKSE